MLAYLERSLVDRQYVIEAAHVPEQRAYVVKCRGDIDIMGAEFPLLVFPHRLVDPQCTLGIFRSLHRHPEVISLSHGDPVRSAKALGAVANDAFQEGHGFGVLSKS